MDDYEAAARVRAVAQDAIERHTGHPYPEGIRSVTPDERSADGGAVIVLHIAFGAHATRVEAALIRAGWWVSPLPPLHNNYGPRLRVCEYQPPEAAPPAPVYRPFVPPAPPQARARQTPPARPGRPVWSVSPTSHLP